MCRINRERYDIGFKQMHGNSSSKNVSICLQLSGHPVVCITEPSSFAELLGSGNVHLRMQQVSKGFRLMAYQGSKVLYHLLTDICIQDRKLIAEI